MSIEDQKRPLPVCLIEQNPLGMEFLRSLIQKDPSLNVLSIVQLGEDKDASTGMLLFVIDNCGLPLPLSACLRLLQVHHPDAKCVVLDRELPREDLIRLLWNKIDGFLTYGELSKSLLTAIHSVAEGNIWIPREILREYVQWGKQLRRGSPPNVDRMTSRESQIIELVKRRFSNKEIGDILHIRECTVKFHLSNIYAKLQVGSRHDLIETSPEFSLETLYRSLSHAGSKA
jgi:DNA-binding NarL/FixJ family response regulator